MKESNKEKGHPATVARYPTNKHQIQRINQGEPWIQNHTKQLGYTITRGRKQYPYNGVPDYYIPETDTFIEEKNTLNHKLTIHQLVTCLQLQNKGHQTLIAIRDTGAIIPLNQYLKTVNYSPKTWKKIQQQLTKPFTKQPDTENNIKLL